MAFGNTFGSKTLSVGHSRKVWREVKDQFPVGGVITDLTGFMTNGVGKIPAGTPCKWEDLGGNGGKVVTVYTNTQITSAEDVSTLGINGFTLCDIQIEEGVAKGTATVVYAGEIYSYMLDAEVLPIVKGIAALSEIKFVS